MGPDMALNLSESALVLKFRKNSAPTSRQFHTDLRQLSDGYDESSAIHSILIQFKRFLYF